MIGVLAPKARGKVVSEFFELFKTPWEFFRSDCQYEVIISVGISDVQAQRAKLVLHYADEKLPLDTAEGISVGPNRRERVLLNGKRRFPILNNCLSFATEDQGLEIEDEPGFRASFCRLHDGSQIVRLGYDLFAEIETLLTAGQPSKFADIPTIEQHIELLREMMIKSGVEFVEIPPVPAGYSAIACLTHDIDHPAIRFHWLDHTFFGFFFRATLGSFINLAKRKTGLRELFKNLVSAVKLPFVYMGCAKDFWAGFETRFAEVEQGIPSTYFAIPYRGKAGKTRDGQAPALRASGYGANDIAPAISRIRELGSEIGTHGIDAWLSAADAARELDEVRRVSGTSNGGIRMHWLYFDEKSPSELEKGGATYDSTLGYRETVGFKCGTTQVFRPLNVENLLELPLTVMDTALFYPSYLNLSQTEAVSKLRRTVSTVAEFGGCITINWHDRSLAPERQWRESYGELIADLKTRETWFATGSQAVAWFRSRRSATFQIDRQTGKVSAVVVHPSPEALGLPGLQLRVYPPNTVTPHIDLVKVQPLGCKADCTPNLGYASERETHPVA